MTEQTLTAMYDTRGAAETARDGLMTLGIESDAIVIRGTGTGAETVPDTDRGFWASLSDLFLPAEDHHTYAEGVRRGGYLLSARVPEPMVEQASEVLEQADPIDLDERAASWRESGWAGYAADAGLDAEAPATAAYSEGAGLAETDPTFAPMATPGTARQEHPRDDSQPPGAGEGKAFAFVDNDVAQEASAGKAFAFVDNDVVHAAEEELRVGKRDVGRGSVRVRSYVTERPVEEQVELRQERVTIERRPVDRELAPGDAAFAERTIEAVEHGEEAVISKVARVTEEIGLRKDVEHETETVRDTLRKQEVEVEDDRAPRKPTGTGTVVEGSVVDPDLAGSSR
jgi:uncharacterized protein (TIGR02271 family)